MINVNNLIYHEFIGLYVEVIKSKTESLTGISGNIIDETKKTIKVDTGISEKIIPKDLCIFQFKLPNGEWLEVNGNILLSRPEDRIKKRYKKI